MKDLYKILEICNTANFDEIKKAYRKLAKKYHPDMNKGNLFYDKRFKEITEAYEILGNEKKREEYDAKNKRQQEGRHRSQHTNQKPQSYVDFSSANKSFESFFGFNPSTGDITNEEKLKNKNPIDTTDLFERFMGIKK